MIFNAQTTQLKLLHHYKSETALCDIWLAMFAFESQDIIYACVQRHSFWKWKPLIFSQHLCSISSSLPAQHVIWDRTFFFYLQQSILLNQDPWHRLGLSECFSPWAYIPACHHPLIRALSMIIITTKCLNEPNPIISGKSLWQQNVKSGTGVVCFTDIGITWTFSHFCHVTATIFAVINCKFILQKNVK